MFKYQKTRHTKNRTLRIKILELLDNIQRLYYHIIPYDWRPKQIVYRLKCFVWHRYTVVHPRTLPEYTWCDRDYLLFHCMFQILTDFVENEFDERDWYHDYAAKIIPNKPWSIKLEKSKQAVFIGDEIKYLYDWWHNTYLKEVDCCYKDWHDFMDQNATNSWEDSHIPLQDSLDEDGEPQAYEWIGPQWSSTKSEKEADKLFKVGGIKEKKLAKELEDNLIRLIYIKDFLWT